MSIAIYSSIGLLILTGVYKSGLMKIILFSLISSSVIFIIFVSAYAISKTSKIIFSFSKTKQNKGE